MRMSWTCLAAPPDRLGLEKKTGSEGVLATRFPVEAPGVEVCGRGVG